MSSGSQILILFSNHCRSGSRDSFDRRRELRYGVIFSIIDGTNCSPKAVLA
jgi:hypothetical protein